MLFYTNFYAKNDSVIEMNIISISILVKTLGCISFHALLFLPFFFGLNACYWSCLYLSVWFFLIHYLSKNVLPLDSVFLFRIHFFRVYSFQSPVPPWWLHYLVFLFSVCSVWCHSSIFVLQNLFLPFWDGPNICNHMSLAVWHTG